MQQPQEVQEQYWEVFQANKPNPPPPPWHAGGYPHTKGIPFFCHHLPHSLGTLTHKPIVKPLALHSCLPIRDPSSGPGKHWHQPPARNPAAPEICAQEFSVFLHSENMGLKSTPSQMTIPPVANASESRGESFWDLLQAITCYWAAPRKRRAASCKPFYAQFISILYIMKKWFASYSEKIKNLFPSLLVCETKSREKVQGLINLQFIFIVSRCFKLLVLRGCFSLSFAVA